MKLLMTETSIQNLIFPRLHDKWISRLLTVILGQASTQSSILLLQQETGNETISMTQVMPTMRKKEV